MQCAVAMQCTGADWTFQHYLKHCMTAGKTLRQMNWPGVCDLLQAQGSSSMDLNTHAAFTLLCIAVERKPGPGAYSPSGTATSSRKAAFSIRAKLQPGRTASFTPGPGQYGISRGEPLVGSHPNAPCYTFGLKTLGDMEADRKPGPAGMFGCCLRLVWPLLWHS